MSKTIIAEVSDEVLSFKTEYSDRYVYSNYFVPLLLTFDDDRTPLLPFYNKKRILETIRSGLLESNRVQDIVRLLGNNELWQLNAMDEAFARLNETTITDDGEGTATGALSKFQRATVLGPQDVEFIAGLLRSDLGYVFLDRTRIRPMGFALGEHVYALSLAPGEEITLEQKTFSKRQVTFEEQNEQERQFDLELSSTYNTEIQEGFERQKNRTDAWGLTWNFGTQYASPQTQYGQVNANFTIGETRNVTEAHQEAMRRSVRDSQTASSKVSARYRAQHKTTFRIVSEQGFEATSKRTIRNPNRTTPVTLHYFKVVQRLQMMQERYGARLCWAPSVKDPALVFSEKIRKGRQQIMDAAEKSVPPPPTEPVAPDPEKSTSTKREMVTRHSAVTIADKWNAAGGMSHDYDVDIVYDAGYSWDGSNPVIQVFTRRPQDKVTREIVGVPRPIQDEGGYKLRVVVHIGAGEWLLGPGISFQVSANFYKDVTITQEMGQNTKYNDDLADYRIKLKDWEDRRKDLLAAAREAADAFEKRLMENFSPVNEMVSQIIDLNFPESVRDELWEIDYWQRLFDWERASFIAYPSWWSSGETRNPTLDPTDFMNASWAKLYLPVRVGMEQLALRWIYGKALAVPLQQQVEKRFQGVIDELKKFRMDILGSADELAEITDPCQDVPEKYRCVARWNELLPTDGTHVEVIQGVTSAADPVTSQEISDATTLRETILETEKRSAKLKDKAYDQMSEPATIHVHVGTGESSSYEQS
jgi:hypothetical protein